MVRKFFGPLIGFDGEGDGQGDGQGGGAGAGAGAGGASKTFTQQEFDSHMANMRRKHEAELNKNKKELAEQLETTKKGKGLSDEERKGLQTRIEELESQYLTDTQKAERKASEERTQFTTQVDGLSGERDNWKKRFETKAASSDIADAAGKHKAVSPSQIRAILGPMITFKEGETDGEPNGEFTPVVKFPDIDAKSKQPIVMEYTIDEAVKRMKELDEYSNLFEDTMKGGLGGSKNTGGGKGKIDAAKLARENPTEFRRLRKENPQALYGSMNGG